MMYCDNIYKWDECDGPALDENAYTNWKDGPPAPPACVMFKGEDPAKGNWIDRDCSANPADFLVCEI